MWYGMVWYYFEGSPISYLSKVIFSFYVAIQRNEELATMEIDVNLCVNAGSFLRSCGVHK